MTAIERNTAWPVTAEVASFASVPVRAATAKAIRLLLVEPDADYRVALGAQLVRRGFDVRGFDDAVSLLVSGAAADEADAIVTGWGMPGMSGVELSMRLRRLGVDTPVVLLAGRALAGRECMAVDPDSGKVAARTRGIEALAGYLRDMVKGRS
jgi:CheY-like chemotaxis protein